MDHTLYVDTRCLQDGRYRARGIGQHVSALLRTRQQSSFVNLRPVALIDERSDPLPDYIASLFDEITPSVNPCTSGGGIFIDGTPMTHDTRFTLRFVGNPAILSAAVVYDFIPLDWPGYLETVPSRIYYFAQLARLRKFDVFMPISEYTAWRLSELVGARQECIHVTGASVRNALYQIGEMLGGASVSEQAAPYFMVVVAMDARKNPEVPIRAMRQLNARRGQKISLKVVGHFDQLYRERLLHLAGHDEGQGFLEFHPNVSDVNLMTLYSGALATIAPSHIEGFSLPVVEASICGCPVIASSCAAHIELIDQPEALFPSHDAGELERRLDALLVQPSLRSSLSAAQAQLRHKYHENKVGERFWAGLQSAVDRRHRSLQSTSGKKPTFAFLGPYPPEASQAAFYSAMTMQAGRQNFNANVFTDGVRPIATDDGIQDAGTPGRALLLDARYDAVISVISNSSSDGVFNFFERFGGPCILHELSLAEVFQRSLGTAKFLDFASSLLGRPAALSEFNTRFIDDDAPLLLQRIVDRAKPLIVQTKVQQAILAKRFGIEAHVTTCCPSVEVTDRDLRRENRMKQRESLGVSEGWFMLGHFGRTSGSHTKETAVLALEFLRHWGIDAELFFVGDSRRERTDIATVAYNFGVADHVHCSTDFEGPDAYRRFLMACDAAIQLRPYEFGTPSADLCNCISAGLPAVATEDMAVSCESPNYVRPVPNHFSPLHVAEELAAIWEAGRAREVWEQERQNYRTTHNFSYYASRLTEILRVS